MARHNWTKKSCATCKHKQGVVKLPNRARAIETYIDCHYIGYVRMGMDCKEKAICQAWTPKIGYKPGNGEDIIREGVPRA